MPSAEDREEPDADLTQEFVAGGVTVRVVDRLEAIEVDEGELRAAAAAQREGIAARSSIWRPGRFGC